MSYKDFQSFTPENCQGYKKVVGERLVQAVFAPFLIADGDEADGVRTGGFGSTGH